MKKFIYIVPLVLSSYTSAETVSGYIESVVIMPQKIHLTAKLDSGADTSSLNAQNIKFTNKDEHMWVLFDVTNANGINQHLAYPLQKFIFIKRRNEEMKTLKSSRRPLIILEVCLGHNLAKIQVNLTNRGNFKYPFLLGREGLQRLHVLVNPAVKFLNDPDCH